MDAWIDVRIQQVDHEIDRHEEQRHHQDNRLDERVVPCANSGYRCCADARPGEDRLDDDGAAEQRAELESDHGDQRNRHIAQRVAVQHHSIG